jgi:hypothetical protein
MIEMIEWQKSGTRRAAPKVRSWVNADYDHRASTRFIDVDGAPRKMRFTAD